MTSFVKHIDLQSYHALLRIAVGEDVPMVLCGSDGSTLWSSEGCDPLGIDTWIDSLCSELSEIDEALRVEVAEGATLVAVPIQRGNAAPGSVVTVVSPDPSRFDQVVRALTAVSEVVGRDIQREAEVHGLTDELTSRNEEIHIIYSFEEQLGQLDQRSEGMKAILQELADTMGLDLVAVVQPGEAPILGANPKATIENLDLVLTQLQTNFLRFIKLRREPVLLNSLKDPRRSFLFVDMPFRLLACPLIHARRVSGMLVLLRHPERPSFSASDHALALAIAHQAELILRNESMIQTMERFGEQMAGALIAAVEAKDPYTRGHSERVQTVSVALAEALEVTSHEIEAVSWGALLHDIGKIGIPDVVLSKPSGLTKDEYTVVKTHPERSYEIIRHIEYLSDSALNGARYHHERFDGNGYPEGMSGKQIPHTARIISVADAFDAITTSRSYRPASAPEKALEIIQEVSGSQLDPDVTEAFLRLCAGDPRWFQKHPLELVWTQP